MGEFYSIANKACVSQDQGSQGEPGHVCANGAYGFLISWSANGF